MDIERNLSPPANEKIVPDEYNILDAHVVRRTTTFNNMLRYRLNSQEKVLSKHRRDAERFILHEKARAVDSLNRINTKLNAVSRIRDFDVKFFNQRPLDNDSTQKRKPKGYQRFKNDDAICQRCYIHHLPLKKRFYEKEDNSQPHRLEHRNVLFSKMNPSHSQPNNQEDGHDDKGDTGQTPEPEIPETSSLRIRRLSTSSIPKEDSLASTMGAFGWWMPTPQNQQFLYKDKSGREVDLNKGQTPRLATNEEWKNVVKNVCSLYPEKVPRRRDLNKTI